MSEGTVPLDVRRLFAAADPGTLARLRDVDYRVPQWGSLVVRPRSTPNIRYVHLVGNRPDDEVSLRVNIARADFLGDGVFRTIRAMEPHEPPERHAARVGSVLTERHLLTFHSPRTPDDVNHAVASWIAFEGGMVEHEHMAGLAQASSNYVLAGLLSALPLLRIA